jgi:hypothetical protein
MSDKVYLARPNWALLDIIITAGIVCGAAKFLEWLGSFLPTWLQWLLLPFAVAFMVLSIIVAYEASIYKQCNGDYDDA